MEKLKDKRERAKHISAVVRNIDFSRIRNSNASADFYKKAINQSLKEAMEECDHEPISVKEKLFEHEGDQDLAIFANAKRKICKYLKRHGLEDSWRTVAFSFLKRKEIVFDRDDTTIVYINGNSHHIYNSITHENGDILALRVKKESDKRVFYCCNFFDERFDRLCFQEFMTKEDAVDHYYSVHLGKKRNYRCFFKENCHHVFTFYTRLWRHLTDDHFVKTNRWRFIRRLNFTFIKKFQVINIKEDDPTIHVGKYALKDGEEEDDDFDSS